MSIGIEEAARQIGVSARRVRQLIEAGRLSAERVGRQWILDEAQVAAFEPARGRRLSSRSVEALIAMLSGEAPESLSAKEKARLRARIRRLRSVERPAVLLRSRLAGRERLLRSAPSADLAALRESGDIMLSGVSHPRSGFASADLIEGYVARDDLAGFESRWMLVEADRSSCNVIVHPVKKLPIRVGLGHVVADLAAHQRPREDRQVRVLISESS